MAMGAAAIMTIGAGAAMSATGVAGATSIVAVVHTNTLNRLFPVIPRVGQDVTTQ
jgi:hypothetical protein